MQEGSISVIFGPMFSGKSTELLRRIYAFEHARKKILALNYSHDNRYESDNFICTHNKQKYKAMKVGNLNEVKHMVDQYDVIAIDEGQFFKDICEFAQNLANKNKIVLVAALDGTFQRQPFNNILSLVPLAENVIKLNAICYKCQRPASFSKRIVDCQQVELIGGEDMYEPVCRNCFHLQDFKIKPSSETIKEI